MQNAVVSKFTAEANLSCIVPVKQCPGAQSIYLELQRDLHDHSLLEVTFKSTPSSHLIL